MPDENYYKFKNDFKKATTAFNRAVTSAALMLAMTAGVYYLEQNGRAMDLHPGAETQAAIASKDKSAFEAAQIREEYRQGADNVERLEWLFGLNLALIAGVMAGAAHGKRAAAKYNLKDYAPRSE